MTSHKTFTQSFSSDSCFISQQLKTIKDNLFLLVQKVPKCSKKLLAVVTNIITDLEAGLVLAARARLNDFKSRFFWGGLLGKPASGERLLHAGGDKDTAFTVLRLRAAVETYAGTSGDLG